MIFRKGQAIHYYGSFGYIYSVSRDEAVVLLNAEDGFLKKNIDIATLEQAVKTGLEMNYESINPEKVERLQAMFLVRH